MSEVILDVKALDPVQRENLQIQDRRKSEVNKSLEVRKGSWKSTSVKSAASLCCFSGDTQSCRIPADLSLHSQTARPLGPR